MNNKLAEINDGSRDLFLVFGSHLFDPSYLKPFKQNCRVYLAEDEGLCTHYRYHKHKLIFFLAAMRHYRKELEDAGFEVSYDELPQRKENEDFCEAVRQQIIQNGSQKLYSYRIEDKFMREAVSALCESLSIEFEQVESPFFLTSEAQFKEYLSSVRSPFMKSFYEGQRKRLKILLERDDQPWGGKWSYDSENRKKLPKNFEFSPLPQFSVDPIVEEVIALVNQRFRSHPGKGENFWLGVTRKQARRCLKDFMDHRFMHFGDYQDALTCESPFVCHSVLSPYLNIGLLTPSEVVHAALEKFSEKGNKVPINAVEGFIRQIIGWREFVMGIYDHYSEEMEKRNFWGHQRELGVRWYNGETGIPPLDEAITKVTTFGYSHHIERLMVVGNLMLLCEVHPREVYRWFMEMHVDSADWVMAPNVYGMSQFSDGGIFATKPYTCGSNYFRKMGRFEKGDWCDTVDGLYWSFIEKHRKFFESNPRMRMMVKMLDKLDGKRKRKIFSAAQEFRELMEVDA